MDGIPIQENKQDGNINFLEDGSIKCPKCKKELVVQNLKKTLSKSKDNGKVLKVRFVLFQDGETILGKCGGCGEMVGLPYRLIEDKSDKTG